MLDEENRSLEVTSLDEYPTVAIHCSKLTLSQLRIIDQNEIRSLQAAGFHRNIYFKSTSTIANFQPVLPKSMADLLLFNICAAASVANTVAILDKTLGELQSLQNQWIGTGPAFIDFIPNLTALKTSLNRFKEWISTDVDEQGHHLLADLEPLVICCRMLARRIDSEIQTLRQNEGIALDSDGNVKSLIKNSSFRELQRIVNHQMSALTVFLAVSEW